MRRPWQKSAVPSVKDHSTCGIYFFSVDRGRSTDSSPVLLPASDEAGLCQVLEPGFYEIEFRTREEAGGHKSLIALVQVEAG